jgi:hypothetical protein
MLKDRRFRDSWGSILDALAEIGPADGEACAAIHQTVKRTRSRGLRRSATGALYAVMFTGGNPPPELLKTFKRLRADRDSTVRHWASCALVGWSDLARREPNTK